MVKIPKFTISFKDCLDKGKVDTFAALGYKSAIRLAIEKWKEEIIFTGGSRVQFAVCKENDFLRFYDAYFEWTEDGAFRCHRIERAG